MKVKAEAPDFAGAYLGRGYVEHLDEAQALLGPSDDDIARADAVGMARAHSGLASVSRRLGDVPRAEEKVRMRTTSVRVVGAEEDSE